MTRLPGRLLLIAAPALAAVTLTAGPALAATAVTTPGDGSVHTDESPFDVSATTDSAGTLELQGPGDDWTTVATGSRGGTLTFHLVPSCFTYSGDCTGRSPARNGTWNVRVTSNDLLGARPTTKTSTFVLKVPPAAPTGVAAARTGAHTITVSWTAGREPDLTGYDLYSGDSLVYGGLAPADVCSGGQCSTDLTYADSASGTYTYALKARRLAAAGGTDTLASPLSQTASATLPAASPTPTSAASPQPSTAPSPAGPATTGGTPEAGGSSTGTTTSGGTTTGGGQQPAGDTGTSGSVHLGGTAGLPLQVGTAHGAVTLPGAPAPLVAPNGGAQPGPTPEGTYRPTLGYGNQTVTERSVISKPRTLHYVTDVTDQVADTGHLVRGLAAALLLVLGGLHLRVWLARVPE